MSQSVRFVITDRSVENGCARCRQVYEKGPVMVLVVVDETQYFLLGVETRLRRVCCGERKDAQLAVFPTKESALARTREYEEVVQRLSENDLVAAFIPLVIDPVAQKMALALGLVPPSMPQ